MKEFYQTNIELNNYLQFIGTYHLFGIIPLDIIAHLIVSIILTLVLLKITKNYAFIFLIIITLGLVKEYYDSFSLTSTMPEHIKDMTINLFYPTISFCISKIKKSTQR